MASELVSKIRFEPGPAADVTGATVTVSPHGIRIESADGQTRYYFGVGAQTARHATLIMGPVPELQGNGAPQPSEELVNKFGAAPAHMGVLAVGVASAGAAGAGAVGVRIIFGGSLYKTP